MNQWLSQAWHLLRQGWRSFWGAVREQARQPVQAVALLVVGLLLASALLADCLANDLPLLLRLHGKLYVLPNLLNPAALRVFDARLLVEQLRPGDFALQTVVPHGYNSHDLTAVLSGPSGAHWLGTDSGGRDVLARVIHGARVSLLVGVASVVVSTVIGVLVGTIAGYLGGWFDALAMRVVEIVHAVPSILLLVTLLAILAPQGYGAVLAMTLVIGLVRWTDVARLVRGEILRIRSLDYVQAARAQGAGDVFIVWRHVLPNAMSPILVSASFSLASAILVEGALSFLGYGIPDDMASWGGLLNEVRGNVEAWWLAVFPGGAIFLTVTAFNLLGEGLRDRWDPRLRT